jgi:hypothetical protein
MIIKLVECDCLLWLQTKHGDQMVNHWKFSFFQIYHSKKVFYMRILIKKCNILDTLLEHIYSYF